MGSVGATRRGTTTFTGVGVGAPVVPQGTTSVNGVPLTPVNQNNPNVQSQVPTTQNTPVVPGALTALSQMSDDELATLVNASKGVQMPNFLADRPDPTQKFVFQAGLNEKPAVLDSQAFNQYMQDNNISQKEIIARSVNPISYTNQQGYTTKLSADQIQDILKSSKLNYIGGKHGGQALGAGAYFEMNGGNSTGYGGSTAVAVLNPNTAKVINRGTLQQKARAFERSHPKFAQAVGSYSGKNMSIYALAMGYNVITDSSNGLKGSRGDYYNIIDRSALVYRQ